MNQQPKGVSDEPELGWIGVDFDGTLAHYDRWIDITHTGAPIELMVTRVQAWLRAGRRVKIFTARVASSIALDNEIARRVIQAWCKVHIGQELEVTNVKDFHMVELWDDRAVRVRLNTGEVE